jgi:Zn-dependent metalloprotease
MKMKKQGYHKTFLHYMRSGLVLLASGAVLYSFGFRAVDETNGNQKRNAGKTGTAAVAVSENSSYQKEFKRLQKVTIAELQSAQASGMRSSAIVLSEKTEGAINTLLNGKFKSRDSRVKIYRTDVDQLGNSHIRCLQYYKDMPVYGSDFIIHVNADNKVYSVTGNFDPAIDVGVSVEISDIQAERNASNAFDQAVKANVDSTKKLIIDGVVAYEILLNSDNEKPGKWKSYIDANTGKEIYRKSLIRYAGPGNVGEHVAISGNRLNREDGSQVTFTGWHDQGGNYFPYHKTNLWGIYNEDNQDWEQNATADWGTSDRVAVSAAKNIEVTMDWCSRILGRNSFDNQGAFARVNVHASGYNNAYWDGNSLQLSFCQSDGVVTDGMTVLDIVAHEFGHAITQFTCNLEYQNESGALNEAYSDIIGAVVEFYAQPDGRSAYPGRVAGAADWLCGEDTWLAGLALRDLRDPQRFDQPSFYRGTKWYSGSGDYGGVHTNSGVMNFAFYLLTEGGTGLNDGFAYSIQGLGLTQASNIALYAQRYLLTSLSGYYDARDAWMLAARTLGYNETTVGRVWDACGVFAPVNNLYATPATLSYGSVGVNVNDTLSFRLQNNGRNATSLTSLVSNNNVFTIVQDYPVTVLGGQSVVIRVVFRPANLSYQQGSITIRSNAMDNPVLVVSVNGTGTQPANMTVNPSSISRTITQGDSVTLNVTIGNIGTAPLNVRAVNTLDLYTYSGNAKAILPGPSKVLVIADSIALVNNMLQSVRNLNNVSVADTFNGRRSTPSLAQLKNYDVVMITNSHFNSWADPEALGNVLGDYADAGGAVIISGMTLGNYPGRIAGKIVQDDYSPIPITRSYIASLTSSVSFENHPITRGVSSIESEVVLFVDRLQANGRSIGVYNFEGFPIGAYSISKSIVALNILTADYFWKGDVIKLLSNCIDWFRYKDAVKLSPENQMTSVVNGSSTNLTVSFNSKKLAADSYNGFIRLYHNDPSKTNPYDIPMSFIINGTPHCSAAPVALQFGNVSGSKVMALTLTNNGNANTTINSIEMSGSAFSTSENFPLRLPAYSSLIINVTFDPPGTSVYNEVAVIRSNAADNPVITVQLLGTGVTPPAASLAPALIQESLRPTDNAVTRTTIMRNSGGDTLRYALFRISQTSQPSGATSDGSTENVTASINYNRIQQAISSSPSDINPGVIILALKPGVEKSALDRIQQTIGANTFNLLESGRRSTVSDAGNDLYMVRLAQNSVASVYDALAKLRNDADVLFAEPDYALQAGATPGDPSFVEQWALNNTGVNGGKIGADIRAKDAWDIEQGSVYPIIAVIGPGINCNHPDLRNNIYVNPREIPDNNIDDDNNGYIDDISGWNFGNWSNQLVDKNGLGTHCAGNIGAVSGNGVGVSGIMWRSSILPLQIEVDNLVYVSALIKAIGYAQNQGARIFVHCYNGFNYSQALYDQMRISGLHIIGAGDLSTSLESNPVYPASFTLSNTIVVTSTNNKDELYAAASFGNVSVDLGAPGVNIYNLDKNTGYTQFSGSITAASITAGVAGLLLSHNPTFSDAQVKQYILAGVDHVPALFGRCVTSGRLNAYKALKAAPLSWFSITPQNAGVIASGAQKDFSLKVNPANLAAGLWRSECMFFTNDNLNPTLTVATELTVSSYSSLTCNTTLLDIGNIQANPSLDTLVVYNRGNIPTVISSVTVNNTMFRVINTLPITVNAFDSVQIIIQYVRTTIGSDNGTISITSNAQDNSLITVPVSARNVVPPTLIVNPSIVVASTPIGFTTQATFTITNSGSETLNVELNESCDWIVSSVSSRSILPNSSALITLTLGMDALPGGNFNDSIMITHNAANSVNPFKVAVRLQVQGSSSLSASRENIDFGRCHLDPNNITFTGSTIDVNASYLQAMVKADFDGDGYIDLAVCETGSATGLVGWFKNNGDGSFSEVRTVGTFDDCRSMDTGDLNNDGYIDIVASGFGRTSRVGWFENNGQGQFVYHNIPTSRRALKVKVGDINSDGWSDVVISSGNSNDGYIVWLENQGNNVFIEHLISTAVAGPFDLDIADYDGDNDIDIASANCGSSSVLLFENNGSENFTRRVVGTSIWWADVMTSTDMNNDGRIDIVVSGSNDDIIYWLENNGNLSFTRHTIGRFYDASQIIAKDLNDDGVMDIVAVSDWGSFNYHGGRVSWFKNNNNGTFTENLIREVMEEHGFCGTAVADYNNDGDQDIVSCKVFTGALITNYENSLNPVREPVSLINTGNSVINVSSAIISNPVFRLSHTFPRALNPGEELQMFVTYYPTGTGSHNGTITFSSDAEINSQVVVTLNGVNAPVNVPALVVSKRRLAKSVVSDWMVTDTVMISNPSTQTLTVSISRSDAWIGISRSVATLPPNGTAMLVVTFYSTSKSAGVYNGSLSLTHNDPANQNPFIIPCEMTVTGNAFTIASSASAGGVITPSGMISVMEGNNQTFTVQPNAGYMLLDLIVDNVSVGPVASYTFNNVRANHSIVAQFGTIRNLSRITSVGASFNANVKGTSFEIRRVSVGKAASGMMSGSAFKAKLF